MNGALRAIVTERPAELDFGGEQFPVAALAGHPIDPTADPATEALTAFLAQNYAWPRAGWRTLVRTPSSAIFGTGLPPEIHAVSFELLSEGPFRRNPTWGYRFASNIAREFRPCRGGQVASSWRLDSGHQVEPGDDLLRILVTEQNCASGQRADGRVQQPDVFYADAALVLTAYVTPAEGPQSCPGNPETPALIELPEPVGTRRIVDGADLAAWPFPWPLHA